MGTAVKSNHRGRYASGRARKFTMLLTEVERKKLYKLAEDKGVSASDFLRILIRETCSTAAA